MTKVRLALKDLKPGTEYAVQLRAVGEGRVSEWSRKFNFTTVVDSVLPKTPANVTWVAIDSSYHGEWDKVNEQLDGDFAKIIRYDVELQNAGGTITKIRPVQPNGTSRLFYDLTEQRMENMFGGIIPSVRMRVRAVTQNDKESSWSTPITATFASPAPPTNAVVEEGINFVKLSWTPPVDLARVDGYRVYSGTTAGFTPSAANRVYSGVVPSYTYSSKVYTKRYFKIRAFSRFGTESTDLAAEGTPQNPSDPAIPVAPTGVTWVAVGDAFHGEWNQVTTGTLGETGVKIDRYELEMTGSPGAVIAMASAPEVASGKPFFTLSYEENVARFIAAKASITMRVRAVTTFGVVGAWSAMTAAASNTPPAAPTGLTGTVNFEYIDLKWTGVSDADLVGYRLYLSTTGAAGTYNQIYQGESLNYSFPSAMYTTDHHFQVKAYDTFGLESAASNTVGPLRPKSSFTVDVTAPGVPTALAASAANYPNGIGAYALISWTAPADTDIAGYTVRYRKNGTTDNWVSQTVDKTTTAIMVDLLQANTQYEFQVRAYDWSANHGSYTASVVSALPSNPVPANVATPTSTGGVDAVTFTWTPVADTDLKDYEVTFSTSATFASDNTTFYAGTNSLTVSGLSSGTTYYARVRARDQALQTSAAWSGTKSQATSAFPTPPEPTDNAVPSSSPAATLSQGIGALFVAWPAIVNNDPVTYEVHLSTTAGFTPTPGGATKVAETPGTVVTLNRDAAGAALSYTSTYYARIIAKDADGPATTPGTVSAGVSPKKAGTGDIVSIVADQIATSSLSSTTISISNTGAIQSNVFNATTGFKISATGIELNDANSTVKAPALEGGTISATTAFILGPNANFITNGGYIKSNVNTGTTFATAVTSGVGFFLSNDGLFIGGGANGGQIKANALISDTLTSTTITLGLNGKIVAQNGWELNQSGLIIPNGGIQAASLNIGAAGSGNLWTNSSFEKDTGAGAGYFDGWNVYSNDGASSASRVAGRTSGYAARISWTIASASAQGLQRTAPGGFKTGVPYTLSWWAKGSGSPVGKTFGLHNNAPAPTGVVWKSNPALSSTLWQRYVVSFYRTDTTDPIFWGISNTTAGTNYIDFDDIQLEEAELASGYTPYTSEILQGVTSIDGGMIKTGSIISNTNVTVNGQVIPLWSIPLNGSATFANLTVRGLTIVGVSGAEGAASSIQSANYDGNVGWRITADGQAYFASGTFKGDISAATGTFNGSITGSAATVTGTITGNTVQTSSASTYVTRMTSTSFKIIGSDAANPLLDFSTGSNTMTIGANAVFKGTLNGVTGTFGTSVSIGPASDQIVFRNNGSAGVIDFYDAGGVSSSMYGYTSGLWITNDVTVVGTLRPYQLVMQSGGIVKTNYLESTTSLLIVNSSIEFNYSTAHNGASNDFYGAIHMNGNNVNSVAQITAGTIAGDPTISTLTAASGGERYVVTGNGGKLGRGLATSSAAKYKTNIGDLNVDLDAARKLTAREFIHIGDEHVGLQSGFVADEADALGLTKWVGYNDEGGIEKFHYDRWTAAQQVMIQHLWDKIESLEEEVSILKNQNS